MSMQTSPPTFEELSRQQLEIFAKEIQEHFSEERRLREELEVRNERLEQRLREITAIERMNQTIDAQNQDLSLLHASGELLAEDIEENGTPHRLTEATVLQRVADFSRELVHANHSVLIRLGEETASSIFTSGLDTASQKAMYGLIREQNIQATLGDEAKPVAVKHPSHTVLGNGDGMVIENLLGIPIVFKGHHLGNLFLANKEGEEEFSPEDSSLMVMFATQAAVAIENAHTYQEIEAQAVMSERDRIGKDLHDNIIQTIYAMGMSLESCVDTVETAPDRAQERLRTAIGGLNEIITNIRDFIMDLRPDLQEEKTLGQRIQKLVMEFCRDSLIPVDVDLGLQKEPALSISQTAQLLSIAKEGLSNVAKHAKANSAFLGLYHEPSHMEFWIEDDGVGFDLEDPRSKRSFGLNNMRERTESLGGRFIMKSAPGKGSMLIISIPLEDNTPQPIGGA